jgi:hypothetical protein
MSGPSPFDHRPDPELGAWLREVLDQGADSAFLDRVLAAAGRVEAGAPPAWQVLGGWARHGVAAVLVGLAAATIWWASASTRNEADASLEEVFLASAEAVAPPFLTATTAPASFDQVLAASFEPQP